MTAEVVISHASMSELSTQELVKEIKEVQSAKLHDERWRNPSYF
jgi:hypothetical protein